MDKFLACKLAIVYVKTFVFSFMLTRTAVIHFFALYDTDHIHGVQKRGVVLI